MSEAFPPVILGYETLRRAPKKKWGPQQSTQTPGQGCWQVAAGVPVLFKQLSLLGGGGAVPSLTLLHECPKAVVISLPNAVTL